MGKQAAPLVSYMKPLGDCLIENSELEIVPQVNPPLNGHENGRVGLMSDPGQFLIASPSLNQSITIQLLPNHRLNPPPLLQGNHLHRDAAALSTDVAVVHRR